MKNQRMDYKVTVQMLSNKSKGVRISVTTCEKRVETCFIYLCDLVSKPDPIVKNLLVSDVLLTFQEYKIPVSRVFDDVSEFLYDVILWTFTVIVHEHRDIGSSKFTRVQEAAQTHATRNLPSTKYTSKGSFSLCNAESWYCITCLRKTSTGKPQWPVSPISAK